LTHIDDFICIGRHRWDMICYIFDGNLIYDIEGHSQIEHTSIFSEDFFSNLNGPCIWQPDDYMVTDFFIPFEDNLSYHTQSDFHSSLDAHPFEDVEVFRPLCSNFDRYQVIVEEKV
jgi:hypothetical protein